MIIGDDKPPRRLWLVFFGDGNGAWWAPLLSPGYRHVSAAAWFDDEKRWLYADPTRRGLVIEIWREDEFGQRLGQLIRDSSLILRVPSRADLRTMPAMSWYCVGVVKALLGVRSRALVPKALSRHLLRIGAEVVDTWIPDEDVSGAEGAAGRPEDNGAAESRAAAS